MGLLGRSATEGLAGLGKGCERRDRSVNGCRLIAVRSCGWRRRACHQFAQKYILFYPKTRVFVVVDGSYGYDS